MISDRNGATYNLESRMTGNTLGNGVVQTWDFDEDRSQLVSQTAIKGANELLNLAYDYDAPAGQSGVTSTTGNSHQLISLTGTINGTTESASYSYDLAKRLVTSNQTTNGASAQRQFSYDRWGNRTGVWDAVSGGNQIQTITLQQSGGAPTNRIQTLYPPKTNFALSANGASASASSNYSSAYVPSAVINGDRKGTNWGAAGGGWMDGTSNSYPDWIQVDFNANKTIDEIDVFTLQDDYGNPSEPTQSMTFEKHGIVDFQIQYWNGSGWQTVSGGSITNSDKVWNKVNFSQITTSKIRVNVTNGLNDYSRVTELEAWGPSPGTSYNYDAAGNVTNDGDHSYTYDAANRLVNVDGGATAQYRYDHQNQRVTKIVGSSWTHYIWEGGQVIGEHDATTAYSTDPPYQEKSARLDYIYARGKMIQTRERTSSTGSWTTRYYVSDVWSTRLVLDTSGNVLGRQGHLAFGEEFAESGTQEKHHFTSYESESETSTDYAVNRQYSQNVGRFGSADPYQASSYLVNPQSWNRYSYVENDPIHNVDPLGLFTAIPGPEPDACCTFSPFCTFAGDDESTPTEPAGSCVITVTARKLDGVLGKAGFLHFFITTWDTGTNRTDYFGAAGEGGGSGHEGGVLVGRDGLFDQGTARRDFQNPNIVMQWSDDESVIGSCSSLVKLLSVATEIINKKKLKYSGPRGPNSNSFAFTLLKLARLMGLINRISSWLKENEMLVAIPPFPFPVWVNRAPGWGQDLL